jgi:Uma2 family endonuclease
MPFPKTSYSGPFTLVINISALNLTSEQFARFCEDNRDLRIEKTAQGELIIMAPAFPETSRKNARIATRLGIWAEQDNTGVYFESSGGFTLPNGAERSPDAAWILRERYEALPMPQRAKRYAPIAPDFVIELRSESDRLKPLQAKMEEYVDNGVRLGWLIDPKRKKVYVYRPEAATEVLHNPKSVSGEDVLPGFVLQLAEIW